MIVRREEPADVVGARAAQIAAFQRPDSADEPIEAGLSDALRKCDGWMSTLSIVAISSDTVVGTR